MDGLGDIMHILYIWRISRRTMEHVQMNILGLDVSGEGDIVRLNPNLNLYISTCVHFKAQDIHEEKVFCST